MLGQLSRFAGVGAMSTLVHVLVALCAASLLGFAPQMANLSGFIAAVSFSYFGHGYFTFEADVKHRLHGPRFFSVAALGLGVSSTLTHVITAWMGLPFVVAMGVVAVAVPASTFVLCKFWVFAEPQREGP